MTTTFTVEVARPGLATVAATDLSWPDAAALIDKVLAKMLHPEHYKQVRDQWTAPIATPSGIMCIAAESWAVTVWPGARPAPIAPREAITTVGETHEQHDAANATV